MSDDEWEYLLQIVSAVMIVAAMMLTAGIIYELLWRL